MLSHPESPQGASFWVWLLGGGVGVGGGGVGGGVGGEHLASILSSLRAHHQGGCDVMT